MSPWMPGAAVVLSGPSGFCGCYVTLKRNVLRAKLTNLRSELKICKNQGIYMSVIRVFFIKIILELSPHPCI